MQQQHEASAGAAGTARPEWCSKALAEEFDAKLERSVRARAGYWCQLSDREDLQQDAWLRVLKRQPERLAETAKRNGYLERVAGSVVTDDRRRQRREAVALERLRRQAGHSWAYDAGRWIDAEFLAATLAEMAREFPDLAAWYLRCYVAEVSGRSESRTAIARAYARERGHSSPSFLWHEQERWLESARCARLATAAF
jgi:hypothetical protein